MLARDSSPIMTGKMASLLQSTSSPLTSKSSNTQFQNEWNFLNQLKQIVGEGCDGVLSHNGGVLHVMERIESGTFALFGEEASIVVSALFNSTASLTNPFGPDQPAMCVLNQLGLLLQEFLLLRDGWRVEIWSWDGLRKSFKCTKRASPGNLESVEDLLCAAIGNELQQLSQDTTSTSTSASSASPVIASVLIDSEVNVSWCDLSSLRIGFLSFQDNPLLTTLESALIQLGVRELLIPQFNSSEQYEKVKQIALASQFVLQNLKPSEFFACEDSKGMEEDLARLVGEDRLRMTEMSVPLTKTMRCLFIYLNLLGIDSNIGAFKLINHNLKDFARLDEAALTSLNIFPKNIGNISSNTSFSLFGFLDHCKTAAGSRTLNQWLRQPLTNRQLIENRLDLVEMFVECPEGRHRLRENVMRGIPDITKLLKKLVRARSSLQEIVQLYQSVAKLHQIIMELESNEDLRNHFNFSVLETSLLEPFRQLTLQLSPFVQMIEDTIDFEALSRNEYCLRPDFDTELQEISEEKGRVLDVMEPEFRRVCHLLKLEAGKTCKMERNSVYGYYFRVSRLDATKLGALGGKGKKERDSDDEGDDDNNGHLSGSDSNGYTELATLKSGVLFTTPKLSQLARRYDSLSEDYADKQSVLVTGLLAAAQPFRLAFNVLGTLLSMLDVLLSLAHVAGTSSRPYVRPRFGSEMNLRGARHPCVEVQPGVTFIPNDAVFSRQSGKILQFITGPNMGGKSTFIRQTALIAIMSQCGCFVPCDLAELPVFDAILVRVGAGDNITRGISTFMAEMLETATILQTATANSLVVIDELGRGTSTCDGISLSRSIAQYLANKIGSFTFFATHFHELTSLSTVHPTTISNLHVSVKEDEMSGECVLLFRVKEGVCDRSYGIHVAKAVNFPPVVLKMAQWRADLLEGNRPAQLTEEEEKFVCEGKGIGVPPLSLQKYFI